MTKKTRRKPISAEIRAKAIADYVSGTKSAIQIAQELGVEVHSIYQWRSASEEKKRNFLVSDFEAEGLSPEIAERLLRQQEEIEMYQKKVAEQLLIIELLKKLRSQGPLPPESELSGLIETLKKSVQKRKRVK